MPRRVIVIVYTASGCTMTDNADPRRRRRTAAGKFPGSAGVDLPREESTSLWRERTVFKERMAPGDRIPLRVHAIEEVLFLDEGRVPARDRTPHTLAW